MAPIQEVDIEEMKAFQHGHFRQVLRQDIGWVEAVLDLLNLDIASIYSLLDPEVRNFNVSHLSQSSS